MARQPRTRSPKTKFKKSCPECTSELTLLRGTNDRPIWWCISCARVPAKG